VNAALCEFLGYSADELKMLTFADVTHPEEHAIDRIQVPRLLAGEIPVYTRAKRYLHSDGEVVWGLVNVVVVRNTLDEPEYLIAQVVDITARKRAEAQLQISNAILEESQAVAKVGGWELTLATGNLFWTEETYRIHEASPENFDPTVDAGVGYFLPESRERIEQALKAAIEECIPYDLELETLTTQGNRIDVRTTGTPHIVDGKVERLSGIFQDITERKNYERSLQEARAQAEHAAQSKGQFLANMSHEIRTPMNAILGLLNLLQTTELTARQRDYASKTEGAAQSLLGLLNDILDFSKVEAGKMTLETEPFRLDRLLRNLSVVLSSNVKSKTMEVLFDLDPALPEVVAGDAMRLQQVLINLGGNAIKFTEHGQVVLALRCLGVTESAVRIEFAVQDSGIGIAPENQAHIFSGFSQAEGSTTRRFGGTGLGLAISKRFVELMGGELQLVSALGQGSTFRFVVDLGVVRDIPAELVEPPRTSVEPQRVLVIDDNAIAGALTLRMVQSWGWPADLARSGTEALELLASATEGADGAWPYPVIYVDWQMPGMDGWELSLIHI
jgi:two-component system sensor histidine kinase/response regulator